MKKNIMAVFVISLNLLVSILFHGIFICRISGPLDETSLATAFPEYEGGRILDSTTVEDSTLVLIEVKDEVHLLELQKNLILPRYQLQERTVESEYEEYTTAAHTVRALYPYQVQNHRKLVLNGTIETGLQWSVFSATYGIGWIVITCVEYIIYKRKNSLSVAKIPQE